VLRYLREFFRQNRVLPSYQIIATELGFSTKSLVKARLDGLIRDGYLEPLAISGNRLGPSPRFFASGDVATTATSRQGEAIRALEAVPSAALKAMGLSLIGKGSHLFRVITDAYVQSGLLPGSLLVVDQNGAPKPDDLVVLQGGGGRQFAVYRVLSRSRANTILVPLDRGAVEGTSPAAAPMTYTVKAVLRAP
jgi:SOS-response transcriptional repressor LexA